MKALRCDKRGCCYRATRHLLWAAGLSVPISAITHLVTHASFQTQPASPPIPLPPSRDSIGVSPSSRLGLEDVPTARPWAVNGES